MGVLQRCSLPIRRHHRKFSAGTGWLYSLSFRQDVFSETHQQRCSNPQYIYAGVCISILNSGIVEGARRRLIRVIHILYKNSEPSWHCPRGPHTQVGG
jgi:hypothetical protein